MLTTATGLETGGSTDPREGQQGDGVLSGLLGGTVPGIGPGFTGSSSATTGDFGQSGGTINFAPSNESQLVLIAMAAVAAAGLVLLIGRR